MPRSDPARPDQLRAFTPPQHLGTLNLFREEDGTIWMTVADARPAIEEAARRRVPTQPMAVVAEWVQEAAQRFVQSWRGLRHSTQVPRQ